MAVSARIQQIYLALFGRPADPVGGEFYDTLTHDGAALTAILTGSSRLSGSAEYTSRFTGMSNTQVVETIYLSLFGHPADLAGLTFYTQALANADAQANGQPLPFPAVPPYTIEQIAVGILDGATGTDAAIIANKTAAAVEFTDSLDTPAEIAAYQGDNAADFGRDFIDGVTTDPASVPTQTQVDNALNDLVNNVANGLSVNLTGDVDNVTTNAADPLHTSGANDVIRGTVDGGFFSSGGTFNNGDQINGGEGYDRLELTNVSQSFGPPIEVAVVATLNNVEELSVRNAGSETVVILDATSWDSSLEKITLHDSFSSDQGLEVDGLKSNVDFNFDNTDGYVGVHYADGALGANATIDVNVSNSGEYLDAVNLDLYHGDADTIATLNVNSTGITNNDGWNYFYFDDENGSGDLTKVVVTGDSALNIGIYDDSNLATFDASGNSGGVDVNLEDTGVDITITGSSNDDYITVDFDHKVTADLGAGDDNLTANGNVSTGSSLSLGAGDDSVWFNGIVGAGATVDGGDGLDTIVISNRANFDTVDAQTAFGNAISNFEVLELDFSVGTSLNLDLAKLDNIATVDLEGGVNTASTLTLDNFTSGNTFELDGNVDLGSSIAINAATGTSHGVANVVLDDAGFYNIDGTLNVTGFETVFFLFNQENTGNGAETVNLTTDATTIKVAGNEGIDFGTSLTNNATVTTVDASGVTGTGDDGAVSVQIHTTTNALTVTTGAGDDHVDIWGQADHVDTGAGDDWISTGDGADFITTGTGNDTIYFNNVTASSASGVDTITDFTSGSDTIDLSNITFTGAATYNGEASSYAAALTALSGSGNASAVLDTSTHQLYVDVNGDGTIGSGDMIITLTGVNDLTNGTHNDIVF